MKTIVITGSNSGIGHELYKILSQHNTVIGLTRNDCDLDDITSVINYTLPHCDILINCAAHDLGGKVAFCEHETINLAKIFNTNLLAPTILTQKALRNNTQTKIVNITSTNNNRYYGNDLVYTLTKKALSDFTAYLKVDYPHIAALEVIVGLTKTNFNTNRHKAKHKPIDDLYSAPHLSPQNVANKIVDIIFDNSITKIEIIP
jgi:short-subunit dehydrogenase